MNSHAIKFLDMVKRNEPSCPKAFITYAQRRPAKYFRLRLEFAEAVEILNSASSSRLAIIKASWKILSLQHELDYLIGP